MNTVWITPHVRWPGFWTRYLRTFGVIGLLGLAVASSTALTAEPLRLAQMEIRWPEEEVLASFTDAADEDPLQGVP